jgi:GH18 family chitinase
VSTYSLDGVCIDWEGNDVTESLYHTLLTQLRSTLPTGKLIAVCAPANIVGWPWLNATLDSPLIDMYEVMMYDINRPVLCTQDDFQMYANMWLNAGFPRVKLDLGIPAYTSDSNATLGAYYQVISEFNPDISENQITTTNANGFSGNNLLVNGGFLWWNSVDLAISKTQWAEANNFGGMMLFAVDYDAIGNPKSLLTGIYNEQISAGQNNRAQNRIKTR